MMQRKLNTLFVYSDEICVLSASGTAAVINFCSGDQFCGLPVVGKLNISNKDLMTTSLDRNDFEQEKNKCTDSSVPVSSLIYSDRMCTKYLFFSVINKFKLMKINRLILIMIIL